MTNTFSGIMSPFIYFYKNRLIIIISIIKITDFAIIWFSLINDNIPKPCKKRTSCFNIEQFQILGQNMKESVLWRMINWTIHRNKFEKVSLFLFFKTNFHSMLSFHKLKYFKQNFKKSMNIDDSLIQYWRWDYI